MNPSLIPRFIALYLSVVVGFWIRLLGRKRFYALLGASTLVTIGLIIRDSV